MVPRPASETIAILRRTLEQIEKDLDPLLDVVCFNELKRIVLSRIAELELPKSIETAKVTRTLPEASVHTENTLELQNRPRELTPVYDDSLTGSPTLQPSPGPVGHTLEDHSGSFIN
jgi:hypothetical protein